MYDDYRSRSRDRARHRRNSSEEGDHHRPRNDRSTSPRDPASSESLPAMVARRDAAWPRPRERVLEQCASGARQTIGRESDRTERGNMPSDVGSESSYDHRLGDLRRTGMDIEGAGRPGPRESATPRPRSRASSPGEPGSVGYARATDGVLGRGRQRPSAHREVGMVGVGSLQQTSVGDFQDRTGISAVSRSRTLIFEGLPGDATENDVIYGLEIVAESPRFETDMIKAVRLRHNKRGRPIAFVEFYRASDATDFVESHPPSISLPLAHSRGIQSEPVAISIDYCRERDETEGSEQGKEEASWKCLECGVMNYPYRMSCFRCRVERQDDRDASYGRASGSYGNAALPRGPILTGETDECPQQFPSQYLVIRGLDSTVGEETLAKGIAKLFVETSSQPKDTSSITPKLKSTAPIGNTSGLGAKPGSLSRVFLMRDRWSNDSWKYGFAEFATLDDAQGAVAKFRASTKFTISSKPVIARFIHTGVFVPDLDAHAMSSDPGSSSSFSPIYNRNVRLRYWDDRAYPSIFDVNLAPASEPDSLSRSGSPVKMHDSTQQSATATAKLKKPKDKTLVMAPQMQMWAQKRAEIHGRAKPPPRGPDHGILDISAERPKTGRRAAHWRDTYTSYADWDTLRCMLCDMTFENTQDLRDHEVLDEAHAAGLNDEGKLENAVSSLREFEKQPETIFRRKPRDRADPAPVFISYADADKLHCLICQRKFKNIVTLRLHERESELHRKSMTNEKNVERAIAELAKDGKRPIKMQPVPRRPDDKLQYRDRAKERRVAFNQPRKPGMPNKRRKEDDKAPLVEEAPPKKPAASKGASLLNKMGWTAGQGLGAEGTGRTEALSTDLYAPGVGLGAEGGKVGDAAEEAAKQTEDSYSAFVETTRKKARARFEKLG